MRTFVIVLSSESGSNRCVYSDGATGAPLHVQTPIIVGSGDISEMYWTPCVFMTRSRKVDIIGQTPTALHKVLGECLHAVESIWRRGRDAGRPSCSRDTFSCNTWEGRVPIFTCIKHIHLFCLNSIRSLCTCCYSRMMNNGVIEQGTCDIPHNWRDERELSPSLSIYFTPLVVGRFVVSIGMWPQ